MIKYPMSFNASAESAQGIQTPWESKAHSQSQGIRMSIPPEFEGPGNGFSPEDLYAMALQNCFIATFKVFAEKSKLVYTNLAVQTELVVDRNESGRPWMARCVMKVRLEGCSQAESAKRILERTSENCMILNSVKTEKVFEFDIA